MAGEAGLEPALSRTRTVMANVVRCLLGNVITQSSPG